MYRKRLIFCFIAARGGSKELPRKNVLKILNTPLITRAIEIAKKVSYIDKIYVSTEDNEIKKISEEAGAIVINRPYDLATDKANYLDVIKHFLDSIPESKSNPILVILNTTTPIRKIDDVKSCVEMYDNQTDYVISVCKVKIPPSNMFYEKNGFLHFYLNKPPPPNRQDEKKFYAANGSVFVTSCSFVKNQKHHILGGRMKPFIMDEKHSVDINTPFDFRICKLLLETKESLSDEIQE